MASVLPRTRRHLVFHPLAVSDVERLTDDAVAITLDVPEELRDEYDFAAGQHLTLRTRIGAEDVRRSYSICAPAGHGRLRVAAKVVPSGVFSTHLTTELRPGDVVDVLTPTGNFTTAFDPGRIRHYAAIAAGSGITPVLSLITTALDVEPMSRFSVVYGNRSAASAMFLDELADVKDRYPDRLQLVHVFSRESGDAELLHGRLDGDRIARVLDGLIDASTVDEWFLCGPYGVVVAAQDVLASRGVAGENVHTELFFTGDIAAPVPAAAEVSGASATVVLDGRSSAVPVAAGEAILDAALRVRPELPFACKGGVCSTCRAKVIDGAVVMAQNYALEPGEVAAGYVLTCQARPTTPTVTVDYDA
jgi:ring-1,2-phenylacetyl-CoA epoxidase subunit PaaE